MFDEHPAKKSISHGLWDDKRQAARQTHKPILTVCREDCLRDGIQILRES